MKPVKECKIRESESDLSISSFHHELVKTELQLYSLTHISLLRDCSDLLCHCATCSQSSHYSIFQGNFYTVVCAYFSSAIRMKKVDETVHI